MNILHDKCTELFQNAGLRKSLHWKIKGYEMGRSQSDAHDNSSLLRCCAASKSSSATLRRKVATLRCRKIC